MEQYLLDQAQRHPAMQARDALKMCYQAAYGAEHLLRDTEAARAYLHRELQACPACMDEPLYEEISPTLCRVNLRAWKAQNHPEEALFVLFSQACIPAMDGAARLQRYLDTVQALCRQSKLPFSQQAWQQELAAYPALCAVHHSDGYRASEHPCYRLVQTRALLEYIKNKAG